MGSFTQALLEHDPSISGLDPSILIAPRRLHLTLGVMSLDVGSVDNRDGATGTPELPASAKTLSGATALLQNLRPRILELLENAQLNVVFDRVDIMRPDRGDLEKAHVMWVGPSQDSEDARRLKLVSGATFSTWQATNSDNSTEFINQEFRAAGFVVDERRPLKVSRTPRASCRSIIRSVSIAALHDHQYGLSEAPNKRKANPFFICSYPGVTRFPCD